MGGAMAGKVVGVLALVLLVAGSLFWMNEANKMRIRDYANFMTETHTRAIKLYDDAEALQQRLMTRRGRPTPEELGAVKDAYRLVAEKTRQEKEAFARVMPPSEAAELQNEGLVFMDIRTRRAESFASYFELLERQQRGEAVSEEQLEEAVLRAQADQDEVMRQTKVLRTKKDELMVQ